MVRPQISFWDALYCIVGAAVPEPGWRFHLLPVGKWGFSRCGFILHCAGGGRLKVHFISQYSTRTLNKVRGGSVILSAEAERWACLFFLRELMMRSPPLLVFHHVAAKPWWRRQKSQRLLLLVQIDANKCYSSISDPPDLPGRRKFTNKSKTWSWEPIESIESVAINKGDYGSCLVGLSPRSFSTRRIPW